MVGIAERYPDLTREEQIEEAVADMSPEERAAEAREAADQGVEPIDIAEGEHRLAAARPVSSLDAASAGSPKGPDMKGSWYGEVQVIGILEKHEAGVESRNAVSARSSGHRRSSLSAIKPTSRGSSTQRPRSDSPSHLYDVIMPTAPLALVATNVSARTFATGRVAAADS